MKLSRRRLKEIASLRIRKYRDQHDEFVVEGFRSVESALNAGAAVREVVVSEALADDDRVASIPPETLAVVDAATFTRLSQVKTGQGIIAVVQKPPPETNALEEGQRILALDGVQDPGNAGTLIRTAAWFGIDAVVAGRGTVDLFNPKTVRASMGGLFDLRFREGADLCAFVQEAKRAGFTTFGADLQGSPAAVWTPDVPSILVVGNEGQGLTPEVARTLDQRILIPGAPARRGVESLNVSQAATILMYLWTLE